MVQKALAGIRVLDFGRFIAAPYCGMVLADMGAEVIRVERSGGEMDRGYGLKAPNGENFTFPNFARNKKGITLDVLQKGDAARQVLHDLLAVSDVFLHNFSPSAIEAFSLTYEDMRKLKPDIIYAGITCYGSDGPYARRNGFDQIAQVLSGATAVTGFAHEPPMRSAVPWVDHSTGLFAAIGILLALRHRDLTGEGQAVDCALLQTAVSYTSTMVAEAEVLGKQRPRLGNRAPYLGPTDLYRCQDGYVYVSTVTDGMWRSLMRTIGEERFLEDPDFATDERRFDNRERVDPLVVEWMQQRNVAEVVAAMNAARIPCGVYRSTAEVAADPHIQARRMLEYSDLEFPGLERVPISGIPVKLSRTPGSVERRAPRVAEHNEEVYRELLGYDAAKLDRLVAAGVI